MAAVFNQCEQFISYDYSTVYTLYAALCGSDSIVVPQDGITAERWLDAFPFGVTYGFEDLKRARETRAMPES